MRTMVLHYEDGRFERFTHVVGPVCGTFTMLGFRQQQQTDPVTILRVNVARVVVE